MTTPLTPPAEDLRVVRYAPGWGYSAREWGAAFDAIAWEAGSGEAVVLKAAAGGSVWRAAITLGGRDREVVLKVEPLGSVRKKVQSLLWLSKGHRQWRGASRLARCGIATAQGCVILRGPGCKVVVIEALPGRSVLEHLAAGDLTVRQQHRVAKAIGRMFGELHRHSLYNRDPKPSNLIVLDPTGERPTIGVVDTVAIRRVPRSNRAAVVNGLALLWIEPSGTCGEPRTALAMRVVTAYSKACKASDRVARHRLAGDIIKTINEHGDPTPVDDPLAGG